MRIVTLALISFMAGCATNPLMHPPGESSVQAGVYVNSTYGIKIRFSDASGWYFFTRANDVAQCGHPAGILCATNPSRLLNFVLTLEDGGFEMSNEDYQTSVETGARQEWGELLARSSLERVHTVGTEALVWTYVLDGEVVVQAFVKRGTQNLRLIFIMPEQAYERRRDEIVATVQSVELGEPSLPSPVARSL